MRPKLIILIGIIIIGCGCAGFFLWPREREAASAPAGGKPIVLGTAEGNADKAMSAPSSSPSPSRGQLSVISTNPTGNQLTMNGQTNNPGNNSTPDFSSFEQYKTGTSALYQDLVVGTGAEAVAGKTLTMDYRGWLTNGQIFDESYARGQAFQFVLGSGQVIAGWEQGIAGMKVGGKRRLVIPPSVGYGDRSVGSIPAGSVLVFDVELHDAK